jgi:hemoglobin/transferrin/lactoferrin receptor protein
VVIRSSFVWACRRSHRAWLGLLCLAAFAPAWADPDSVPKRRSDTRLALKEVVVSGSRQEADPDELALSIDVLGPPQLEQHQVQDIRDAAELLPNVAVARSPARFSLAGSGTGRDQNAGFNIRGLDGNRVLMLVDGVRLPRSYVFKANAFGRDYLDLGLMERIEVVKGPVSALYGSDGMAGLVNFITLSPSALLAPGRSMGGRASLAYDGAEEGWQLGGVLAGQPSDALQWLLSARAQRSAALKNLGTNGAPNAERTEPNPEHDKGQAVLAKLLLTPGGGQRHTLTFEHTTHQADFDLLSAVALPPLSATSTVAASALNDMSRDRLTWDGRLAMVSPWADELRGVLSYQRSNARQYTMEARLAAPDRVRDTQYNERSWQAGLQVIKRMGAPGAWLHQLNYGFDAVNTEVETLQTGQTPAFGERFPLKRFPDTRESGAALYVQDEILYGAWSLTPGLRYEHFKLNASQAGFSPPSSTPAASLSGHAVSPKLGLLYHLTPQWSIFANYAEGFRAPNAAQVNGFFENLAYHYKSVPNPNLLPEQSRNLELGVRRRQAALTLDASVFKAHYRDFIEDRANVGGSMTAADPTIFQSINIGRARISGIDIKGDLDWGLHAGGRWITSLAYGQTRGRNAANNRRLNSVQPQRLLLGLRYDAQDWSTRLGLTRRAAKRAADVDGMQLPRQFLTPAATTLDLSGQWRLGPGKRLNAGVYNLGNRKVWNWADVQGLTSDSGVADAYTQPGRHVRVTLVADF